PASGWRAPSEPSRLTSTSLPQAGAAAAAAAASAASWTDGGRLTACVPELGTAGAATGCAPVPRSRRAATSTPTAAARVGAATSTAGWAWWTAEPRRFPHCWQNAKPAGVCPPQCGHPCMAAPTALLGALLWPDGDTGCGTACAPLAV